MLREVQKKIEEFHMLESGDRVIVGVSGGADSVGLLKVLQELSKKMSFLLEVVHVEHGIRGEESRKDAEYVTRLCEELGVACQVYPVEVPAFSAEHGIGFEEAARILRYEIFEKLALEKKAKIALAHHQEDNVETILFQLVRGSSLTGLCGMQPVRKDENGVCYIRPLLFFHRGEIETFLQQEGLSWCVDSTNAELEYSRNFLRAQVIPELVQLNAQAVEHINQTASHLSEIKDYLDMETERFWKQVACLGDRLALESAALLELHVVMQRKIAYKAITYVAKQKKDITAVHVEELIKLCKGQSGKRISLPYGMTAWKEFETVYVQTMEDASEKEEPYKTEYEISERELKELLSGRELEIVLGMRSEKMVCRVFEAGQETLEIPRKTYTKWFDYDKIKRGFCIRTRRSGDYFISDDLGHRKKLKEYFIEEKIPKAQRGSKWLLADGNQVLWLIGGRISEHIKVSQKTSVILEITYDGGNKNE